MGEYTLKTKGWKGKTGENLELGMCRIAVWKKKGSVSMGQLYK